MTRLVHRSGWTVIACVNETTKLPDGTKCPAFALLVRRSQAKNHFNAMDCDKFDPIAVYLHRFQSNHSGEEREAILAVRGTASMMDWSINLNETPDPFLYYTNKPSINHDYLDLQPVEGSVHRGMHQGAMAILDSFAMRQYLTMLSLNGYAITMVGHSLGKDSLLSMNRIDNNVSQEEESRLFWLRNFKMAFDCRAIWYDDLMLSRHYSLTVIFL